MANTYICSNLQDPIRLHKSNCDDVKQARLLSKKGLVLYPSNDIVKRPRGVEKDCRHTEIPVIHGWVREDESSMKHAEE